MMEEKGKSKLFNDWPEKYDFWFNSPIGALIRAYESSLLLEFLNPKSGELILDAGCGTGIFTLDILQKGARVVGIDISLPMLRRAKEKSKEYSFHGVTADMLALPFPREIFDRVISSTALEFIPEGEQAVQEMFRVAKKGAIIVVATLNSLSPWAQRRQAEATENSIFAQAIFRSPEELLALAPVKGMVRTAIHFQKNEDPHRARFIEEEAQRKNLNTGAFVAARWIKS